MRVLPTTQYYFEGATYDAPDTVAKTEPSSLKMTSLIPLVCAAQAGNSFPDRTWAQRGLSIKRAY